MMREKLYNELNNLRSSLNSSRVVKSKMKWERRVERMGELRNACRISVTA
jgi:hypothetical protein